MSKIKIKGQNAKGQKGFLFAICLLTFVFCGSAHAASNPLASQKHDKHAPIEITSDTLEVFQSENRAVFTGHVVAIQADDRLKGDQMIVYYRKQDDPDQAKNAKPAKSAGQRCYARTAGAIKKIDADGNVFLSTPEETASGAKGIYDVKHHEIHLSGSVVLTRGQNVLKGDKLVYNFDTGKSILAGGRERQVAAGRIGKQRVHALFVPDKENEQKKRGIEMNCRKREWNISGRGWFRPITVSKHSISASAMAAGRWCAMCPCACGEVKRWACSGPTAPARPPAFT